MILSTYPMPWRIVIFLSKFGLASNILSFVLSMLWDVSKISFNRKPLCQHHFLWDISYLPSQPLSSRMPRCVCLPWVPLGRIQSLEHPQCQQSHSWCVFYKLCLPSSAITLFLCGNFIFVGHLPCLPPTPALSIPFFALSLRDKEAISVHTLLFIVWT